MIVSVRGNQGQEDAEQPVDRDPRERAASQLYVCLANESSIAVFANGGRKRRNRREHAIRPSESLVGRLMVRFSP